LSLAALRGALRRATAVGRPDFTQAIAVPVFANLALTALQPARALALAVPRASWPEQASIRGGAKLVRDPMPQRTIAVRRTPRGRARPSHAARDGDGMELA